MIKFLHRPVAWILLFVLGLLQASIVVSTHSYHADDAMQIATHAEGHGNDQAGSNGTSDPTHSTPSVDVLIMADCAEHCGGAAILITRRETPTMVTRGARILSPALNPTAARPERLERPPKPTLLLA